MRFMRVFCFQAWECCAGLGVPKGLPHYPFRGHGGPGTGMEETCRYLKLSDSTGLVSLLHSTVVSAKEPSTGTLPTTATSWNYPCPLGCLQVLSPWVGRGKILLVGHWQGHCFLTWSCDLTSFFFSTPKTEHRGITSAIHRLLLAVSSLLATLKSSVNLRTGDPACCLSVVVCPLQWVSLPVLSGTLAGPGEDTTKAGSAQKLSFLSGKSIRKDKHKGWLLLPRVGVCILELICWVFIWTQDFFCGLFFKCIFSSSGIWQGVGLCVCPCVHMEIRSQGVIQNSSAR